MGNAYGRTRNEVTRLSRNIGRCCSTAVSQCFLCCLIMCIAREMRNERRLRENREDAIRRRRRELCRDKRELEMEKEELLREKRELGIEEMLLNKEIELRARNENTESQRMEEQFPRSLADIVLEAGISMTKEEYDLCLRFQLEIGTTRHFSMDRQLSIDAQKSFYATETFIQQNHPDIIGKWAEYKEKGKLCFELIDVIYAKERDPELHEKKHQILDQMERLHIIARGRSFSEHGEKLENYFFAPCMLRQESPIDIITPEQDICSMSTSVLCYVFTIAYMPPFIFDNLLTACVARWPVAKKKETSENLIFRKCAVFALDLLHRLTLYCWNNAISTRIEKIGIDVVNTPDEKLCTRVRKFLSLNLTSILSSLDQKLQYDMCIQIQESNYVAEDSVFNFSSPFQMWFADEGHDPDAPITPEHMNHSRLCVALVTICTNAMREVLLTHYPAQHNSIYQAIVFNKAKLTKRRKDAQGKWQKAILSKYQRQVIFPYPKGQYMAPIDRFDITLLYILIRNVSTVSAPSVGWGNVPSDQPRDRTLGASVERIRLYRNQISGHSVDGKICKKEFEEYWNKIEAVVHDIEVLIGSQSYSKELEKQKMQVISVYEAC